jgi:hypothetical protein
MLFSKKIIYIVFGLALAGCDSRPEKFESAKIDVHRQITGTSGSHLKPGQKVPSCFELDYNHVNYHENMESLARKINSDGDDYVTRYLEDLVSDVCKGNIKGAQGVVESGFITRTEAQNVADVLGKNMKFVDQSDAGKKFSTTRSQLVDFGLCQACADNAARYVTEKPDSECGMLVTKALQADETAATTLAEFPDYCQPKD